MNDLGALDSLLVNFSRLQPVISAAKGFEIGCSRRARDKDDTGVNPMVHDQIVASHASPPQLRLEKLAHGSDSCLGNNGRFAAQLGHVHGHVGR